jgi:hypothetical protein
MARKGCVELLNARQRKNTRSNSKAEPQPTGKSGVTVSTPPTRSKRKASETAQARIRSTFKKDLKDNLDSPETPSTSGNAFCCPTMCSRDG